jgi:hypothetical protein
MFDSNNSVNSVNLNDPNEQNALNDPNEQSHPNENRHNPKI